MRIIGYVVLLCGISVAIHEFAGRTIFSVPMNIGVVIGYTAMILLAIVTLAIAPCFKLLEDRLSKLEGPR